MERLFSNSLVQRRPASLQRDRLRASTPGDRTEVSVFSLARVACLGCCALAPVMVVDDEVHGKMTQEKIGELLDTLRNGGGD